MTKILVTGAGGFAGTHLIKELQKNPAAEIFASVYNATSNISVMIKEDHLLFGDLTDYSFAQKMIQTSSPDIIYHLAALSVVHTSAEHATAVINGNTSISYNLLEAVKLDAPKTRFIAICSANQYGAVNPQDLPLKETAPFRPLNPYAVSKVTQEMLALSYCLAYGLDVVILRPFNHTGEGQTTDFVIPMLAKQFVEIERGKTPVIDVGNLETSRDFTDVLDMVQAYVLASEKCLKGESYNIGSGVAYSVQDILDLMQKITGRTVTIKRNESQIRLADVPVLVSDSTKFRTLTSWSPTIPLETTLSRILEYWRKQI